MDKNETGAAGMPDAKDAGEAWREVGVQFQQLGESLGAAFRAAWTDAEVRRHAQQAQSGLEAMATEVGKVVSEMAESPKVKEAAQSAAATLRTAGEETVQVVRPHLVEALRQLNLELQKLVDNMESKNPGAKPPAGGSS
jgi:hypothetical protein